MILDALMWLPRLFDSVYAILSNFILINTNAVQLNLWDVFIYSGLVLLVVRFLYGQASKT